MRIVAIYSRVSTDHHHQNPQVQVEELRRYCDSRKWTIAHEIVDHGFSGSTDARPGFKKLLALARRREIDVVVITRLDRLFRSLKNLLVILQEFSELGVEFVSVKDQIDMTTAAGRLMMHVIAAFGEFERTLLIERTCSGLAYARSKGKALGRPVKTKPEAILTLRASGLSYQEICSRLKCSPSAVTRAIRAHSKPILKSGSEG